MANKRRGLRTRKPVAESSFGEKLGKDSVIGSDRGQGAIGFREFQEEATRLLV